MVKQFVADQNADQSDWLIGAEILGPSVNGFAVRSMALPGSAYDDPLLGKDPQPSHMRDYVDTTEDNGGVHINSGILNHGFYIAAMTLGGKTWDVLGKIWYAALTKRLKPEATTVSETVDVPSRRCSRRRRAARHLTVGSPNFPRFVVPLPLSCHHRFRSESVRPNKNLPHRR